MSKAQLKSRVAVAIIFFWAVTLFMPFVPRTGIQAAVMIVMMWLYVARNGGGKT